MAHIHVLQKGLLANEPSTPTITSGAPSTINVVQLHAPPMKQWLTSLLRRNSESASTGDKWPAAYERLTASADSAGTPRSTTSSDVAAAAVVASMACTTLRMPVTAFVPQIPKLSVSSFGPFGGPIPPTAETARAARISERRPQLFRSLRSKREFILQLLVKYASVISTAFAAIALCILLSYVRPLISQHRTGAVASDTLTPLMVDALPINSSFLAPDPMSFNNSQFYSIPLLLSVEDELVASKSLHFDTRRLDASSPHLKLVAETSEATNEEFAFARWDLALCVLLLAYILFSYVLERMPFSCLHESVVSVVLGILLGLFVINRSATVRFDFDLFNYILLPPIIFGAGFNLKKQMFYRFFGYVAAFGIFLTMILFVVIATGLEWINRMWPFTTVDGHAIPGLTFEAFLVLSAVLCCSDTVASLAFIKPNSFPAAHAVVFGEGVMNDVVSIILSQSLIGVAQMRLQGQIVELPTSTLVYEMICDVSYYLFTSSLVGLTFGLVISYGFKKYQRAINDDPVRAVSLIFVVSYMSYIISEMLGFSAILSIFLCGIVTGHYAWQSLTTTARILASKSSALIGFVAEAFIFGYFGVAASSLVRHPEVFSVSLIVAISVLIPLCRLIGTPVIYLFICLVKGEFKLTLSQDDKLLVLMGGMMRGTVSYALIIHYVQMTCTDSLDSLGVVYVSTVLGVVLANVMTFGIGLPILSQWLARKHPVAVDSLELTIIDDARHLVTLALDSMHQDVKTMQAGGYDLLSQPLLDQYPATPNPRHQTPPDNTPAQSVHAQAVTSFREVMKHPPTMLVEIPTARKATEDTTCTMKSGCASAHLRRRVMSTMDYGDISGSNYDQQITPISKIDWTAEDAALIGETILRSFTSDTRLDSIAKELRGLFLDFLMAQGLGCSGRSRASFATREPMFYSPPRQRDDSNDMDGECSRPTTADSSHCHSDQSHLAPPPLSLAFWEAYRPQQVRKGVDRWWHGFDNQYMKPIFGGRVDLEPHKAEWTARHLDHVAPNMTQTDVERYQNLLREVLLSGNAP